MSTTKKPVTKKQSEVIALIKHLVNLDFSDAAYFLKRGVIGIEFTFEHLDRRVVELERIGYQYKRFSARPNGYRKVCLVLN